MSYRAAFSRLYYIVEKIKVNKGITAKELMASLHDKGIEISKPTLERDLKALREEFCCDISYNTNLRGYVFISFTNSVMEQLLTGFANSNLLMDLEKNKTYKKFIITEGDFINHLNSFYYTVLKAMDANKKIKMSYKKVGETSETNYLLSVLVLKEYNYKRYIIAQKENGEIRSFFLNRVKSMELTQFDADVDKRNWVKQKLNETIGITKFTNDAEEIVFVATKERAVFLKEIPLHHSQQILKEISDVVVFKLKVVINKELIEELLANGEQIRLLQPKHLITELTDKFKLILHQNEIGQIDLEQTKAKFNL